MTESSSATDTIYNFEMTLLTFSGQIFSNEGKVVADEPKNREAIVKSLKFFGEIFTSGYVPPDTLSWSDGDNNANFHSKSIVMTPNPSVSIPAHHYFNAPDNYFNKSATIEWPDGPDGRKPTYMVAVKTVLFPKDSANKKPDLGKEFVKFVVDPKRFAEYIKGANGRWFPAFKDVAADPFFSRGQVGKGGEKDPHLPTVTKIYLERNTKVFEHWKNPANSQIYAENVWGKAMTRMDVDKWSAEKAADEAIGPREGHRRPVAVGTLVARSTAAATGILSPRSRNLPGLLFSLPLLALFACFVVYPLFFVVTRIFDATPTRSCSAIPSTCRPSSTPWCMWGWPSM